MHLQQEVFTNCGFPKPGTMLQGTPHPPVSLLLINLTTWISSDHGISPLWTLYVFFFTISNNLWHHVFMMCEYIFPMITFHKDFNIHWWSLSGLVVSEELSKWGFSNSAITSLLTAILHERIHPSATANKLQFFLKNHTGCVYPPCIREFWPSSAWSITRTGKLFWKEFSTLSFIGHVLFVANNQLCHCMKVAVDHP